VANVDDKAAFLNDVITWMKTGDFARSSFLLPAFGFRKNHFVAGGIESQNRGS